MTLSPFHQVVTATRDRLHKLIPGFCCSHFNFRASKMIGEGLNAGDRN